MIENIDLFDFTLSDDDLHDIRLLDTGRNVTGWPSDALKYNPESIIGESTRREIAYAEKTGKKVNYLEP